MLTFKTKPWNHQLSAVQYNMLHDRSMMHCWMGTGKSKISIDTIYNRKHHLTLIVCPKAVMGVWPRQFLQHYPGRIILSSCDKDAAGKLTELKDALRATQRFPVAVIINYDSAWRGEIGRFIKGIKWDCIILDESHRIKTHDSQVTKFFSDITAKQKICLTGTPMPNSPEDIFGQYLFLEPEIFGKYFTRFKSRYFSNNRLCNEKEFSKKLDMLRFEAKADVLDLPEMNVIDIPVKLTTEFEPYIEMYRSFSVDVGNGSIVAANAAVRLLRLLQITAGYLPNPDSEGVPHKIGDSKITALIDLIDGIGEEPAIIFYQFIQQSVELQKALKRAGRKVAEISGARKELDKWDSGKADTVICQTQSAAEGIDLTRSKYMFWLTLPHSLGKYEQALARFHRPGQKRNCFAYRLLGEHTVDERVADALSHKKEVITHILEGVKDERERE